MKQTKKGTNEQHNDQAAGNAEETTNPASTGAVLPDPEEIKLPPLHKQEEQHRTVVDVDKPKDNNTDEDSEDQGSWDFRRNK